MKKLNLLWVLAVSLGVTCVVAVGYALRASLFTISIYSMSFYGLFALTHFVLQAVFAHRNNIPERRAYDTELSVSVVVATYKEKAETLTQCLISIKNQLYNDIRQVILSNDGDDKYIQSVFDKVSQGRDGWLYLHDGHRGKRHALYRGFGVATGDIIVCIDSDTVIAEDAIYHLVKPFADKRVGCATGNVRVLNRHDNFLTYLTDLRYWLAFNLERAAQSLFGVMSCVSGPFGAYRREVIDQVKDRWLHQRFLGNPCTFGDDRHLTNLTLSQGYKSVYVPQAKAETESPSKLNNWLRQQLRWSRSFYREFIINVKWFKQLDPWLAFDLTYQAVFPLFLLTNLVIILYLAVTGDYSLLYLWISLVVFFGLIRAMIGALNTKSLKFIAFSLYGFIHILMLLPLRVYALATVWKTTWK